MYALKSWTPLKMRGIFDRWGSRIRDDDERGQMWVGRSVFAEGGVNFANVLRIKEVVEGNLGKSLISLLSTVI